MALQILRQAALRPASYEEIKDIIGSRFVTFPQPKRTQAEAAAFWADYFTALEGMTYAQIEGGMTCNVCHPDADFLWKPGRLADAARSASPGRWARAYTRARTAVVKASTPELDQPRLDRPSAEEMKKIMDDFHAKLAAKAPPPATRPLRKTPSAVVDDSGISQEARALLRSQGAQIDPPVIEQDHYGQEQAA